jgi:hypothetical protein
MIITAHSANRRTNDKKFFFYIFNRYGMCVHHILQPTSQGMNVFFVDGGMTLCHAFITSLLKETLAQTP